MAANAAATSIRAKLLEAYVIITIPVAAVSVINAAFDEPAPPRDALKKPDLPAPARALLRSVAWPLIGAAYLAKEIKRILE